MGIRATVTADAAAIQAIYAPIVTDTAISFELEPPGVEEMRRRMEAGAARFPWLTCEIDGVVAGYAYAGTFRARPAYQWTAEVTVYVHADHRGRGIGKGLYTGLLGCLRVLGYCTAVGVIALPNPASVRLHESLGFKMVGVFPRVGFKLGRWHDTAWWVRELQDLPYPAALRRPAEVADTPAWRSALDSGLRLTGGGPPATR